MKKYFLGVRVIFENEKKKLFSAAHFLVFKILKLHDFHFFHFFSFFYKNKIYKKIFLVGRMIF
jgi:hypothetical protein